MASKTKRTYEAPDMTAFVRRVFRGMVKRAGEGDREAISALADMQRELDAALCEAVAQLRAKGNSWTDVGRELRITRQAAQQRFGKVQPGAGLHASAAVA